ncbi:hypothetical protein Tco_0235787 [Tanacetum coccineum]
MENLYPKHGLISRTYYKKSLIMASTFGSKSKFFMTVSIPSKDEPLTNRPVAIALPQDVPSTSDRRLIELENQVQRLMEAHLALTQPTQVNKITTSCEICSGPHDTQYCMGDYEQAYVDYASSRTNEMGGKKFTPNQGPRNFNDAANTWKEKPNFNWAHSQTFTSPQNGSISVHSSSYQMKLEKALLDFDSNQEKRLSHLRTQLGQQQDDMIGKINLLWKTVSEKLNDVSTPENAGNSMAPKSIAAISHDEREELRKKGIKSPSKLFSPKYLSPASIKELNKNPSAPKHVHFVNLVVILSKDSDTEDDVSLTNACRHDLASLRMELYDIWRIPLDFDRLPWRDGFGRLFIDENWPRLQQKKRRNLRSCLNNQGHEEYQYLIALPP